MILKWFTKDSWLYLLLHSSLRKIIDVLKIIIPLSKTKLLPNPQFPSFLLLNFEFFCDQISRNQLFHHNLTKHKEYWYFIVFLRIGCICSNQLKIAFFYLTTAWLVASFFRDKYTSFCWTITSFSSNLVCILLLHHLYHCSFPSFSY